MREGGRKNNKKRRERKRVTDSALHHPLFSKLPLVYALLIKGSAKNCPSPTYLPVSHPTPNPHTHSLQENSPGRSRRGTGGLFRRVTGEGRMTVKQKEKATEEEKEEEKRARKQSLRTPLAEWIAVVLLHFMSPRSSPSYCCWKLWQRHGGSEGGRGGVSSF